MRKRFDVFYRVYLAVCVVVLVGSVWAEAQTATNKPTPVSALSNLMAEATSTLTPAQDFWLTFGLNDIEALQPKVLGSPLWKYLAFAIYIFLAWLASRLMDLIFQKVLKRLTARTESTLDDALVELMHGPVKVITFVILLHVGLNIFDWPVWVSKYLSIGLKLVVAWSVTYMAARAVDVLMRHLQSKARDEDRAFDAQLFPLLRKGLKLFIVLVAILVTAQNLDFNITGILASLSIGGLALGLAAQDTLGNLFGAIAIFADKPFKIGDRVQLDSYDGVVERIGLRSTKLRNLDGYLVAIPNKTMGNSAITNISERPSIRTIINIGLTYDTPAERIEQAVRMLKEIYQSHPKTKDVWVAFDKFEDSALNIQVVHWWRETNYQEYLAGMQSMNLAVKRRFDDEKLEFAFPTQTVVHKHPGSLPGGTPPIS